MKIDSIQIDGLFNKHDIRLSIADNALVLVGPNGLGKSTVLNIVHYTLTKQWDLLQNLPFQSVSIGINGETITLNTDALRLSPLFSHNSANALSIQTTSRHERRANTQLLLSMSLEFIERAGRARTLEDFVSTYTSEFEDIDFQDAYRAWTFMSSPPNKIIIDHLLSPGPINSAFRALEALRDYRIMYLPTYRRIEKTLQDLFPDIDEAIQRYQRTKSNRIPKSPLVEFVQFGMEDVRALFETKLSQIRTHTNRVLSATSGNYLRDVIRGQGSQYDAKIIRSLDDETVKNTLHRYEGDPFSEEDINAVLDVPNKVRARKELAEDQKLIAHYLIRLIEAMNEISTSEKPMKDFVATSNNYLRDKIVKYSDTEADLTIQNKLDGKSIDIKDLSSGEKQIMSLLSHVYLEEKESILFIDEPELSLSVDWQTRLLPDLRKSGRCAFLFAVTHSPFIFENDLELHTVDLGASLGRIR